MFSKILPLNSIFQDFFDDISDFYVSQKFVDFFICIYRRKMKKVYVNWFLFGFNPLIFFKIVFLENFDRYEAKTFRVNYL